MAVKTNTKFVLPATYEEWVKLVDLHEAYDKHTFVAPKGNVWSSMEVCTSCGWVRPHHGKLEANLNYIFQDTIRALCQLPIGKYMLRRLTPAINAFDAGDRSYYDLKGFFEQLPMDTLKYLNDTVSAPWAALALAKKTSNLAQYRPTALQLAGTAYEWSMMRKLANDEERRIASKSPGYALKYARNVDQEYKPVTRMGAMRKPDTAVSYFIEWGSDFTLTDTERKRCCRTKYGASMLSEKEKVDRPEYRKALKNSMMYGDRYIYGVAGQRCADMELGCRVSTGFDLVEYLAVFDLKLADMGLGKSYRHSPYSHRTAGKLYDAMLTCTELAGHLGKLEPADILTMPFKLRSAMAAGYVFATKTCTPELYAALQRNRAYKWAVVNLDWRIRCANEARLRQGMPLIASSLAGLNSADIRKVY
jgi:hypothetical protein